MQQRNSPIIGIDFDTREVRREVALIDGTKQPYTSAFNPDLCVRFHVFMTDGSPVTMHGSMLCDRVVWHERHEAIFRLHVLRQPVYDGMPPERLQELPWEITFHHPVLTSHRTHHLYACCDALLTLVAVNDGGIYRVEVGRIASMEIIS